MMGTLSFLLLGLMLSVYVLLDGYDLGVGAVSLIVARGDRERQAVQSSIGPFWNGNEVWLIAAGGVLFALFPQAYASAFSGFYLPFMVVLWALMFRGISFELRNHFESDLWRGFWDVAFSLSSIALALLFGVAFGNLLRGFPLDAQGYFQGTFALLLNPYAVLVGVLAVAALAQHGALYVAMRLSGPPADRAAALQGRLWWLVLVVYAAVTAATFAVRPAAEFGALPLLFVLPLAALAGLILTRVCTRRGSPGRAFAASSVFVAGTLASGAATIYPYLLPGYPAGGGGLSIFDSVPSPAAVGTALGVAVVGLIAVALYTTYVARKLAHPIVVGEEPAARPEGA
ncbi:MAG TPA: cytochrome d ubiquinol oxidase subunit II [Candidatus Dormibacteraeota bacterium]|nr:cytochrome d ubiquinol oxidase subunit II [Candidatus Dormibacteraeota bacterium]